MRLKEFATTDKKWLPAPSTPQQARLNALKTQKDNASKALDSERKRQKVQLAQQNLQKAIAKKLHG